MENNFLSNVPPGKNPDLLGVKTLASWQIILISFGFLICASLLYSSISNPVLGLVFGLPVIILGAYAILKRCDPFSYLLIIFVCNHFGFYDDLWNLLFLGTFLFFNSSYVFKSRRKSIFIYLFKALFLVNVVGLILDKNGILPDQVLGFVVFCGYFLIFYLLVTYEFEYQDIRRLFEVLAFIVFFQLVVSLIQKTGLIGIDLPFLPLSLQYDEGIGPSSVSRVAGTFGDFELLAEYAAFLFVILTGLLLYKQIDRVIARYKLVSLIASLFVIVLLTGTRSSLFIICFALLVMLIMHLRVLFSIRLWMLTGAVLIVFNIIVRLGDPLGLQLVFDRIGEMDMNNDQNQTADEVLNRDLTFHYAYKRLAEQDWIIGNGFTTGEGYRKSLFGSEVDSTDIRDYHSLYLSMPIFFGWIGAVIFGLLVLSSLWLYAANMLRLPKSSFAFYFSFCLFLSWLLLFVNEYKIQFIRFPNYFFLVWFLMGLSINLSKKISNEDHHPW